MGPTIYAGTMTLRELWEQGGVTLGAWCGIPSVFSAELVGRCGFDWVCVDTQHGLIGYDQMAGMLQGLAITGTPAFVRVPWNQPDHIMKALDAGAQGIVVPMIGTAEQARAAVAAAKYPPEGYRSWGPIRASLGVDGYSPEAGNRRTVVALMIETAEGVQNMDEILSVPGVDAIYIGPSDLAIGHGMSPTLGVTDPEHERLVRAILDGCRRHGVVAGIHCDGVRTVERWRAEGFRMLTVGSDGAMLRTWATDALQALRGGQKVGAPGSSSYA
jgi:4-hydroxy-2-oxoheptanedioate aldolase